MIAQRAEAPAQKKIEMRLKKRVRKCIAFTRLKVQVFLRQQLLVCARQRFNPVPESKQVCVCVCVCVMRVTAARD